MATVLARLRVVAHLQDTHIRSEACPCGWGVKASGGEWKMCVCHSQEEERQWTRCLWREIGRSNSTTARITFQILRSPDINRKQLAISTGNKDELADSQRGEPKEWFRCGSFRLNPAGNEADEEVWVWSSWTNINTPCDLCHLILFKELKANSLSRYHHFAHHYINMAKCAGNICTLNILTISCFNDSHHSAWTAKLYWRIGEITYRTILDL